MKTLITLAVLLLATPVVAQDSEVKNERNNEKAVEIGKRLRAGISTGKISPEEAKKRFAEWRKSQADTRNDDSRKHTSGWMRGDSGDKQFSREHRFDRRGQRKGTEGTDRRDYRCDRDDSRNAKEHRRGSERDSKRYRSSSKRQKLQHRPDSRQYRGLSRKHQGACGWRGERADKNRRGVRGFERGKRKGFRRGWSDRTTRRFGQRVRTVR